jgi:hypothetical protein
VATFSGCKLDKAGTYTLTATDGSLTSATSASLTVTQAVTATKVTSTVNTSTSETTTTSSFTSTSGATYLVLIMHQDATTTGNITASLANSSGLTNVSLVGNANKFQGNNGQYLYAFSATASGTSATVRVDFSGGSTNQESTVEVIQLSGNTSSPIAQSVNGSGTGTPAAVTLTTPNSLNGEVVIVGVHQQSTITAPAGYSLLDTQSGSAGGGFANGVYIDSAAQGSSSFGITGTNPPWGTIAIEINHA